MSSQQLMISITSATDKPDLLKQLLKALLECGGHLTDSYVHTLGNQLSITLLFGGSWDALVKIENVLPRLQHQFAFQFITQRTDTRPKLTNRLPYIVEVIAPYQSQLVYEIIRFFSEVQAIIEDLHLQRYTPSNTDAQMFSMNLTIYLPLNASLANVRGDFMDLCDALNADAVIAPLK